MNNKKLDEFTQVSNISLKLTEKIEEHLQAVDSIIIDMKNMIESAAIKNKENENK